jgi:hypothetical protein
MNEIIVLGMIDDFINNIKSRIRGDTEEEIMSSLYIMQNNAISDLYNNNEYKKYLSTANTLPISRKEMKRQACEFFYMRNLYGTSHELNLRKNFLNYYQHVNYLNYSSKIILKYFLKLINCEGWKKHIRLISKEIET